MLHGYQRPQNIVTDYFDDQGKLIPYGNRFDGDDPPAESYSVISHPQRFAPLHAVADSLVNWMTTRFNVRCYEDPDLAAQYEIPLDEVVRSIRLVPEDSQCAPVGLVFTKFPGLHLQFGALFTSIAPNCGCDACDDSVPDLCTALEAQIDAVTSGAFVEILDVGKNRLTHQFNVEAAGMLEQSVDLDDLSSTQLAKARAMIPADGSWAPWPLR